MNRLIILFIALVMLAATQAACDGSAAPTATRDELGVLVDTQTQATVAAAKLNGARAEATTRAEATLQYLAIIGQQTRIAQQAVEMQTTQAQNARETQTIFAQRVTATQVAYIGQATATRVAQDATATAYSGQVTATRQSQDATATAYSAQATATRQAVEATQTRSAVIAQQTQVSAFSTATADAANARATQTSGSATATVIAAGVIVEEEKAAWNTRLESIKSIATVVLIIGAIVGFVIVIGTGAIRFIDAGVLRARVLRDKTGTVLVIGEKDKQGRQAVFIPGRSPGAVLSLTPPEAQPWKVEAQAVDPETTKRDQAVSLMIAASQGKGGGASTELLEELNESPRVQVLSEPPEHLLPPAARDYIEGEWKRLSDGNDNR